MTNTVLEVMNYIDPALVEEVELDGKKRWMSASLRVGLIAACMCLALAGTGAAAIVNGWVKVSGIAFFPNTNVNGTESSYANVKIAYDGTVYIPMDQFSQEARDIPRSSTYLPQYRGFDSWGEAEEFLGIEIANNPVLDQMEPFPHTIQDNYGLRVEDANCIVGYYGQFEAPAIYLAARYQLEAEDGAVGHLVVNATIVTQPLGDERIGGMTFNYTQTPVTEDYVTPAGLSTVIVTARGLQAEDMTVCQAAFQLNGASFTLYAIHSSDGTNQIVDTMKEILDAYS